MGGSSVMFSSNSAREESDCAVWSLAWSSVACSVALADACFRSEATRTEAGELALWKRVTMSLVLCYLEWVKSAIEALLGISETRVSSIMHSQSGTCLRIGGVGEVVIVRIAPARSLTSVEVGR